MHNLLEVPSTILLFAFRYALNRNTGAPLCVTREIRRYWNFLSDEFKRQVKEDIEREIRLRKNETDFSFQVSEDWIQLLEWIKKKQ